MSHATGYIPRDYNALPMGKVAFCAPFDLPIPPRNEWPDRIDYLNEQKATAWHIIQSAKLIASDQARTNFCWAHGMVNAMRIIRAMNGQPYKELSAAAVAAQITKFRNEGGNNYMSIPFLAKHGVPTVNEWPANAIDRQYVTEAMKAEAAENTLSEWYELEPKNEEQKMACLLYGFPVPAGYMDIGHMMCAVKPMYRKSGSGYEFGSLDWNSWGQDYNGGTGCMERWGSKFRSFDQCAPRVVRVSD